MRHPARILAVLGLAGCASSERMLRIQPFSGESAPGPDRVNLWPLAYVNRDEVALLWPLVDVDERGFAVRPLVAKDDTRWSILYPWGSFDASTGEGWLFPLYNVGGYKGIFPVAGFGRWSYAGPAYWSADEAGAVESGGFFPLFALGGRFNYVGPVFWHEDERGVTDWAGLFPISAVTPGFSYAGPAWWDRDPNGEVESWGVFPFFGTGRLDHAGPLWRTKDAKGQVESFGFFPLVWARADGSALALLPFYNHSLSEVARERTYLLGLGTFRWRPDRETNWIFPFWFHDEREQRSDTVAFPLYYRRARGGETHVFTLLGDRRVEGEESGLNVYPLWWSSDGPESRLRMLIPFFYYGEEATRRTLLTPLGGFGWDASGQTRFVNVLGPLFHLSAPESGGDRTLSFLWPLVEHARRGEESSTRVLPLFGTTSTPEGSETWIAGGLGHIHDGPTGTSWRLWPLASRSSEEEAPGPFYDLTLFNSRRRGGRSETRLFPLYEGVREPGFAEDSILLGIGHRRRGPEGSAWRLWPLVSASSGVEARPSLGDLTLFGHHEWEGGSRLDVGGPLLFSLERTKAPDRSTVAARGLVFFTYDEVDRLGLDFPSSTEDSEGNLLRSRRFAFLLGAVEDATRESRVWKGGALEPEEIEVLEPWSARFDGDPLEQGRRDPRAARAILEAHGAAVSGEGPEALRSALAGFVERHTETQTSRSLRVPPLFRYRAKPGESGWSALFGLVGAESKGDRSRFSVLYSLFRTETQGERTTRDIFPFLTWDSGPDESRFSFLWRFFRYERVGGRKKGHFLFIPWGGG